ncbi:uncharacterized protein At4g00950-like [Olea europaea var. sylvestris]|uniref:uncharacterized protein At4g00950-like n=1 Tax=Olea europaea var. sylvestris TaxID=158386 RepID=UPI000C1CE536|nr:uncharacterized protein At4g00950-like [Olea europaea var. sylvestris]
MGFQDEVGQDSDCTPKLPLFSKTVPPMMQSPYHSGMLTPPLHTLASVPFQWEEEPGKPRPCTALIELPNPKSTETKCLELPPRLFMESTTKITKTPSPTTVLDGPYVGEPKFSSSSFKSLGEAKGSFDGSSSKSPEKVQLRTVVICKKGHKRRGLFDSWGKKTITFKDRKKEIGDDSAGTKAKIGKLTRNGSFSSFTQARSHIWDAIYEGFKKLMPWKNRKSDEEKLKV